MGVLDEGERVVAADAAIWRSWLARHHASSSGVWLVRPRSGNDDAHIGYEDAVRQALCFGWIDGPVRNFDERIGGLWFAPRRASSGWAATNKARVAALEAAGLLEAAGIRAIDVAKANGAWIVLDGPEAGIEPADLTAALDMAAAARAGWDCYPPSVRKLALTQIALAKRPETRQARIARIVTCAAEGRRP